MFFSLSGSVTSRIVASSIISSQIRGLSGYISSFSNNRNVTLEFLTESVSVGYGMGKVNGSDTSFVINIRLHVLQILCVCLGIHVQVNGQTLELK